MRNAHVKVKLLHTRKEQGRKNKKKRGGDLARRLKKNSATKCVLSKCQSTKETTSAMNQFVKK